MNEGKETTHEQSALYFLAIDANDELLNFLLTDCRHVMPKWIFDVHHNSQHEAIGPHADIAHCGNINCGAYGDVYLVLPKWVRSRRANFVYQMSNLSSGQVCAHK
jgi:hypothetical protein